MNNEPEYDEDEIYEEYCGCGGDEDCKECCGSGIRRWNKDGAVR